MSSEQTFEVGEVAIFWAPGHRTHGCEVTITGPLQHGRLFNNSLRIRQWCDLYPVTFSDAVPGRRYGAKPENLRKKPQPGVREKLGSWDNLPFYTPPSRVDLDAFQDEPAVEMSP